MGKIKITELHSSLKDILDDAMRKSEYAIDSDGKVNIAKDSEKLGGKEPSYYASNSDLNLYKTNLASQELNKGASLIGIHDADNKFTATNVEGALKELFINVSDGKQVVATAITGKGVPTSSSDTFGKMATNIDSIITDPSIGTTNAMAGDLLSTKKAISQGQLITGTIPDRNGVWNEMLFREANAGILYMVPPTGYYFGNVAGWRENGGLRILDPNFVESNIRGGANVLGMAGKPSVVETADATIPDSSWLLTGASAYKNGVKINGTMPNHGAWAVNTTTQGAVTYIPGGYHNGSGYVHTMISNLTADVIKSGVNVGGVVGTLVGGAVLSAMPQRFMDSSLPSMTESVRTGGLVFINETSTKRYTFTVPYSGGYSIFLNTSTEKKNLECQVKVGASVVLTKTGVGGIDNGSYSYYVHIGNLNCVPGTQYDVYIKTTDTTGNGVYCLVLGAVPVLKPSITRYL
jgi:hypothetical protein